MDNNGSKVREISGESVAVLQLSFTPATFRLEIGGNLVNADIAIAMLDQAKRHFENELRKVNAMRLQQELAEMVQNAKVAAALRH